MNGGATEFTATLEVNAIHASVVLVSSSQVDTQSVKPDLLKPAGIIPKEWTVLRTIDVPVFLRTEFSNGFVIQAEGDRYVFQEPLGGPFKDVYDVHGIASKYVEMTKLTSYKAVGINWQFRTESTSPGQWLSDRGMKCDEIMTGFSISSLQVRKALAASVCNITFISSDNFITIDCNYHFETGGLSAEKILSLLSDWAACQHHLLAEVISSLTIKK